jgi:threonine dehydrogenase-like Zn-dependent dehydrogenase
VRALTVQPGLANSLSLDDWPEPQEQPDRLVVRALALGVCGTDREIIAADYGTAPPGSERLVIGHESLGEVMTPAGGFAAGDHVVGIVRRPDPVPCPACAGGEWDMCRNGRYTERGIKQAHGYGAERFALEPAFAVKVDTALGLCGVLLEPASVVAKAWDHVLRIGARSRTWAPRRVLITGAGPVGLLAALLGRQRGLEVHVYDRARDGPKPKLVADLGGAYHCDDLEAIESLDADIVIECTGAGPVVAGLMNRAGSDAILCLTGISSAKGDIDFDIGGFNRGMVLRNDVVFGAVNANRVHYEAGARALAAADPKWLAQVITRRVPLDRWREAYEQRPEDVKVVIDFSAPAAGGG